MIFTERTIRVSNGTSSISSPIILYKGDKNIKIRFKIVDCPYTYSKNVDNIIETSEASYAQLIIKTPNNGSPILSDIAEPENGYVTFVITGEMIDEAKEVGKYSLQVRLLDDEQYGRITIPEVVDGIEVREPMVTEGVSTTNEVDVAVVDYAVTTAATAENVFDSEGNYIETNWQSGDIITSAKLNKIEDGITGVNSQVKDIENDIQNVGNPTDEQVQNAINTAIENGTLQSIAGTTIHIGDTVPVNGEKYWYDTSGSTSDTPLGGGETTTYTITNTLTNCSSNNATTSIDENSSYTATITANDGYELGTITVTMGGTDITSSAVSGSTITISSVTGNVVITCTATLISSGDIDVEITNLTSSSVKWYSDGGDTELATASKAKSISNKIFDTDTEVEIKLILSGTNYGAQFIGCYLLDNTSEGYYSIIFPKDTGFYEANVEYTATYTVKAGYGLIIGGWANQGNISNLTVKVKS